MNQLSFQGVSDSTQRSVRPSAFTASWVPPGCRSETTGQLLATASSNALGSDSEREERTNRSA